MRFISGNEAENRVAEHVESNGSKIVVRNWRTPACELDIVATRKRVLYVVEVKYRLNTNQGSAFDYINKQKIVKLKLGTTLWQLQNDWTGEVMLVAASVTGIPPEVQLVEMLI